MSITTPSPSKTRPRTAKFTLVSAVALGLIGGPVALAAPADASTHLRGCTVDPLKPTDRSHWVDFRIKVDCRDNKTVQIRQLRYEDERGRRHDDFLGGSTFRESFNHRHDSSTVHSYDRVQDRRGPEKVYQLVSFRVRVGNHWSDWTRWEKSQVATLWR
ncbi:hypothetical protein [uncultured Arthrobacter sp.]|uniref:hypothetical protein n=1 Tax=uncultured Arthrobacter sp. TaxID=114050 RepID=UPI003216529F